jgi:hypothetical protein
MKEYHKIQTVFLRDPETSFKALLEGQWALPEFDLLKDINWQWTEKIDGTNIRVIFEDDGMMFQGKTDNAEVPKFLLTELNTIFTLDKLRLVFPDAAPGLPICLYGEGYGAKIQKGGNYIPDKTSFILFDVKVGELWLSRKSVVDIAFKLDIQVVPIIGHGTLLNAVKMVQNGFTSTISHNRDYMAEGLIMKPVVDLFNRKGDRIVAKIKHRDFAQR